MSESSIPIHFVCTYDQARDLIEAHSQFFLANCGCRERKGKCERSRIDTCLCFDPDFHGTGSGMHPITREEAIAIWNEAQSKLLVPRPFRNEARTAVAGVCFCCDDCCSYFLNPEEPCDKGDYIVETDFYRCNLCAICVDECHFHARELVNDELIEHHDLCYGCGLCAMVCPEECIVMKPRPRT
jgi:Pyruvate/2-oxoacid:ferredoxin oxidoreductase delta subunit